MQTHMAPTLRRVADDLEAGRMFYDWRTRCHCNCGVVAQAAMNAKPDYLLSLLRKEREHLRYDWSETAEACGATGLPLHFVLRALLDLGFEMSDFQDLEYLSDASVRDRAGLEDGGHDDLNSLILYLRAWADLLDEQADRDRIVTAKAKCEDVAMTSTRMVHPDEPLTDHERRGLDRLMVALNPDAD